MPLYSSVIKENNVVIAIWRISESKNELLELYQDLSFDGKVNLSISSDVNLSNSLASRLALAKILEGLDIDKFLNKDEFGKLHLENNSDLHISVSHCTGWACAIVSKKNVGIDVEIIGDRVNRIQFKFCSGQELEWANDRSEELHYIWGAKESMYKAYGRKQVDFSEEMLANRITGKGSLSKKDKSYEFDLHHLFIEEGVMMVYCVGE